VGQLGVKSAAILLSKTNLYQVGQFTVKSLGQLRVKRVGQLGVKYSKEQTRQKRRAASNSGFA
jgi:hypothetical protein